MIKTKKELSECLKYEKKRYGTIPRFWFILSSFGISDIAIIPMDPAMEVRILQ